MLAYLKKEGGITQPGMPPVGDEISKAILLIPDCFTQKIIR
jgi:hypothetical protein